MVKPGEELSADVLQTMKEHVKGLKRVPGKYRVTALTG
jgi:hypothetical protein